MPSFTFPPDDNKPRYNDAPLGPVDRLRSWLGWTIEADMLFGPPAKTLRDDTVNMIYTGGIPYGGSGAYRQDYPIVLEGPDAAAEAAFWNDGGVLAFRIHEVTWHTSPVGLLPGAVWDNGLTVAVVPGITPNPAAPPVFFGSITPFELLMLGGGNLPLANPFVENQLWNNGGLVCISTIVGLFILDESLLDGPDVLG